MALHMFALRDNVLDMYSDRSPSIEHFLVCNIYLLPTSAETQPDTNPKP